jgi:hypothetical protein
LRGPLANFSQVHVERAALALVVVATAWLTFAAAWGIGAIPGGGHLGAGNAGTLMAAEQIVRWGIPYPARDWYSGIRPEGATLMCHHPYGQYYVPALLYWLFGHHDALNHAPAVAMSACIPSLLYGIGKERWGAAVGAVAATAYVVVPIAVGFASYWNLETICIFGTLLFFWGHSRHVSTGQARYAAASLAGLAVTCSGDWVGWLLVFPTLAWACARAFFLPRRWTRPFRVAAYARWWATSVIVAVSLLALWIGLFAKAGQIEQWLGAGEYRGGGGFDTLSAALTARRGWIDFSFTPLAIAIGKIAVPVCVLRLLTLRQDEETYALGFLFGAGVQYVTFKKGADVHIFWPHYFAAYFALALAGLADTAGLAWGRLATRAGRSASRAHVAAVSLALGLLPAAAMTHDAVASLWVWRRTGGRYDDNGAPIRSEVDVLSVLRQVVYSRVRRGTLVDVHPGLSWGWEYLWTAQARSVDRRVPAAGATDVASHPFWVARASGIPAAEQGRIATLAHVRAYGDAWIVDQREPAAPIDAYRVDEHEPDLLEWLFYGGTEPVRRVSARPDPWLTWEWRTHLGEPADTPAGDPASLEQIRIAHNIAAARGDADAAAKWRTAIERALDRGPAAALTGGINLLGVRRIDGVEPRVETWFALAQGASPPGDMWFSVRSKVEARAPWSLIPPDPTDREVAFAPSLSTKLWRAGFIYAVSTVLDHRIGRERYVGAWRTRDGSAVPVRLDGRSETTLLVEP